MKNIILLSSALISMLFVTSGLTFETANLKYEAFAQTNNNGNAQVLEQLISNLTQAQSTVSNNDSSAATTQLTTIIAELSDILGKITTDNDGKHLDEHTHFFTHKDHVHTVTHSHPHHSDHHSHSHQSWTEKHHIFDPNDCAPGRMC